MSIDIAVETNGLCHLCSSKSYFFGHITGRDVRKAIFCWNYFFYEKLEWKFNSSNFETFLLHALCWIFSTDFVKEIKNDDYKVSGDCDVINERFQDTR